MRKFRQGMRVSLIAAAIVLIAGMAYSQQNQDSKAVWTKVLQSEVAQPVSDKGLINYQKGYVEAKGIGAPPPQYYGKPQARPMALRAATVDGYRNLAEIIQGVQIDSQTSVKDFVVESDQVNTQISALVKGARTVKSTYLSDGTVEVLMRIPLSGVTRVAVPPAIIKEERKDPEPIPVALPQQPEPSAPSYTGLVIDARGLRANAAVSPKVLDENGAQVYGILMVDKNEAARQGLCGYAADVDMAQRDQRVASNPLLVKAVRAEGSSMSDLRISNDDAQMVRAAAGSQPFLKQCRVMVVIEPRYEGGCVPAGTSVTLADGTRKVIESLRVNDMIVAYDPKKGTVAEARIEQVVAHNSQKYVLHQVKTKGNHDLMVTGNHPVLTKAGGWKEVDQLKPGDAIYVVNADSRKLEETIIAAIIRDKGEQSVVYNIKTSQGNYLANDIVLHNKCLKAGSPIDTPSGIRAVEAIQPGDTVWGRKDGVTVPVRVTNVYMKRTVLSSLPGKQLTPALAVTENHLIHADGKFIPAGEKRLSLHAD